MQNLRCLAGFNLFLEQRRYGEAVRMLMLETDALLLLEDREGAARCGGCLVGRVAEVGRLERPMRAEVESALLYFEQG